jgi:hypothetical protein
MIERARRMLSRRALRSALGVCALALTTASCEELFDPVPNGALRFSPPPIYQVWWDQTVACANISRSMREIDFYVVPDVDIIDVGRPAVGAYYYERSDIVLAGVFQFDGGVVRHEMLHALIPSMEGHPREYFLHRCGDIVGCVYGACTGTGSPLFAVPADIAHLPAESLTVSASVVPAAPVRSVTGDWLSLVITATNPKPYPILVRFEEDSVSTTPRPWGYEVDYVPGSRTYTGFMYDEGMRYFRAGETKRAIYDFSIVGSGFPGPLPLGVNTFTAWFGRRETPPFDVTIAP